MHPKVNIHDIRRHGSDPADLRAELVAGLTDTNAAKHIPSIMLWDEEGQGLFEAITSSHDYYPYRAELELLERWSENIVQSVESGTVIIELGAGCVHGEAMFAATIRSLIPS